MEKMNSFTPRSTTSNEVFDEQFEIESAVKFKGFKVWRNKKNGFTVALLHYSADPEKGEAWVDSIKRNMAPDQWEQEYEINWGAYIGKRFFQSFKTVEHVRELDALPGKPVLRGWDFGFHFPAVVFCQIDDRDRLMILDEYHTPDVELERFSLEVIDYSQRRFPGLVFRDYCDPAGSQRSDKTPRTSIEILNKHGIYPVYRWCRDEQYAWGLIRQQLLRRPDGKTGLLVDPRCRLIVEGFESRMRYRSFSESRRIKEEAVEEHPFIDLFDALKYLVLVNFDFRRPVYNGNDNLAERGYRDFTNSDFMAM